MTDDKTIHTDMADNNGRTNSADDERLLMILGEALGDMPDEEETRAAWQQAQRYTAAYPYRPVGCCCRSCCAVTVSVEQDRQ